MVQTRPNELMEDAIREQRMTRIALSMLEGFCYRMGLGIRTGLPMMKLLESEKRQGTSAHRTVMAAIAEEVQEGYPFSAAMERRGNYFPPLLVQLVKAGEHGGGLDRIFEYMAVYYKDLRAARSLFLARITWPCIQIVIALLVVSGLILLQGLLKNPKSPDFYDALGMGLYGWGGFFRFWTFVLTIFVLFGVAAYGIWKNWLNAHQHLVPLVRNIPVLGPVFTNSALSRFSLTLSMLLNAGVEAKKCVRESYRATGNQFYIRGMRRAVEEVEQGNSLAHSFESSGVFPREFIESVEIGELSGSETDSLERMAVEYNRRFQSALIQLSVMLSVAIWILIAAIIIFFIFRMVLRYISLITSFSSGL